jgi:hypothetical protein
VFSLRQWLCQRVTALLDTSITYLVYSLVAFFLFILSFLLFFHLSLLVIFHRSFVSVVLPFSLNCLLSVLMLYAEIKGYAVAQLVEALRYKPEGRRFDSRWSHWNFSVT